jgi:transcriptional regulator with XRE-family HTH domain
MNSDTVAISHSVALPSRITVDHPSVLPIRERIREARELANLSRAELGRRVGVRPSAAVQWEGHNGTAPSVENLAKIAAVTLVSFEWLATGRGAMRVADNDGEPAVMLSSFAQNLFEERVLRAARRVPARKRDAVISFLEDMFK